MRWAVLLLLLGGCDLVFGFEQRRFVDVEVVQRTHLNDARGVTVIEEVALDDTFEVRVLDLAGGALPVERVDDATYRFAADDRYRVLVTDTLAGDVVEYQLANDTARIVRPVVGRRDAMLGNTNTNLIVDLQGSAPLDGAMRVVTTGVYGSYPPISELGATNNNFRVEWKNAPLVDKDRNDRIQVLHFKATVDGNVLIAELDGRLESADLDMPPNTDTILRGPLQPLATDRCARLSLPGGDEIDRLIAAAGRGEPADRGASAIVAATQPDADLVAGIGVAASVSSTPANATLSFTYADPFADRSERIALMTVFASFDILANNVKVKTGLETRTVVRIAGACPAVTTVDAVPAIAGEIAIAGTRLVEERQGIRLDRERSADITWTVGSGLDGSYAVRLLRATASGAFQLVGTYLTNERRVSIPESDLDIGETYLASIVVHADTTRAAAGDFTPDALGSQSARDSYTFRIEN